MDLPDLDPNDERPLHQQIASPLRQAIESGAVAPGGRMPGENAIMERYGVARGTAREALSTLANLGLITKIPKVGTFARDKPPLQRRPRRYRRQPVSGPFALETSATGRRPNIEASTTIVAAGIQVAERLDIRPGSAVVRTEYQFLADDRPIQSSISFEPHELTNSTPVEIPEEGPLGGAGVVARMDSIGQHIATVLEEVTVRPPTAEESTKLAIPSGVHVFAITRTFWTAARPVETADIVIPGDRYALVYEFAVPDGDEPPATS